MARLPTLLVIGGPTASRKTTLSIQLAQALDAAIISGDSRQFYREMKIGNARPSPEELAAAAHHFIADRSVGEPLTAGRFADEALALIKSRLADDRYVIVVGGSGLYLRALYDGLDDFPEVTHAARARVQSIWEQQGLEGLQRHLQAKDPTYFGVVDRHNPRRLTRALEVCFSAPEPYSRYLGNRPPRPFSTIKLSTDVARPTLYDRINRRVDTMIERGLETEAGRLAPYRDLPVLQTVGYREWWPYLQGERDLEATVALIKRNSRRYAKRQITWFRKDHEYEYVTDVAGALEVIAGHRPGASPPSVLG